MIVISLGLQVQAQSKIDSTFIPHIDSLKTSLRLFYQVKSDAEQEEFKYKSKFKFLRFLPSIGWDAFRMSPIVSVNSNSIYYEINRRRETNAKLSGLEKTNEVQYNSDISNITFLRNTLQRKVFYYNAQIELLLLEEQRFQIIEKAYDNHEIVPSEYLTKQIAYQGFKNSIKLLEVELYDMRNKILTISKQAPWESLY
jgi:hypothetical protein